MKDKFFWVYFAILNLFVPMLACEEFMRRSEHNPLIQAEVNERVMGTYKEDICCPCSMEKK